MCLQRICLYLFSFLVLFCGASVNAGEGDQSEQIKRPVSQSISIRQNIQKDEVQWREEKQKLLSSYEQLELAKKRLTAREQLLVEQVNKAQIRIEAKQRQLEDIEQIQSQIAPLIENISKELEQLVASDLPFLTEERRGRLQRIEEIRDDPEVSVSEKYRKVMEALLIEAEYGNTIEVYQDTIASSDHDVLVDIFRLGRVGLFFQSLDQKQCGFYNVATSSWQNLPVSYNHTIRTAVEIGSKRRPVELLTLPLGRMHL